MCVVKSPLSQGILSSHATLFAGWARDSLWGVNPSRGLGSWVVSRETTGPPTGQPAYIRDPTTTA